MSRWGLPSASHPVTCPSALFLHCRHYFGLSITWTLRQMAIYNWPKARCSQQKSGKSFKVFAKQQFRKLCEIKHKLPNDHVIGPKGLNRGPSWRMSDAVKRIAATSHFLRGSLCWNWKRNWICQPLGEYFISSSLLDIEPLSSAACDEHWGFA